MKRIQIIENKFIKKIGFCSNKIIELRGKNIFERNLFIDSKKYDYGFISDFRIIDHYIFLNGRDLPQILILNCKSNELIENDEYGYPQAELINKTKI